MKITSQANPKIKELIKTRNSSKASDRIVIEGSRELKIAIESSVVIDEIYLCHDFSGSEKHATKEHIEVSSEVFKKMSVRQNPDGVIAVANRPTSEIKEYKPADNALVVILESPEKPGNIGAVMRTADGAGVDAVIVTEPRTDIYNHNAIRSSMGTVFSNRVFTTSNDEIKKWLKLNKFEVFAAFPEAKKDYYSADLSKKTAILIGEEHGGLSEHWEIKDVNQIKLSMLGKIDSLNASVSAGILIYEALRQRKSANLG